MKELGKRLAVAAVGIPTVLVLVYLGGWFLAVPLAAFAAWGTHEVARMARERGVRPMEWISVPMSGALVLVATLHATFTEFAPTAVALLGVATVASLVVGIAWRGPQGRALASIGVTVFSAVYVGMALAFVPLLRATPVEWAWGLSAGEAAVAGLVVVALPLAITWIGDAAAYFAGSTWGRAKLAPSISPNKSWVGFWANVAGGGIAAVAWVVVFRRLVPGVDPGPVVVFAGVGAAIGCAAVFGDLAESLIKREAGVKDSGTFFPGHGGVLDRIDSLLFTIPSAYAALALLEVTP